MILAGVTIATLTGNHGILTQAEKAKNETAEGELIELIRLAYNEAMIDSLGNGVTAESLNKAFIKNGIKATASGTDTIRIQLETGKIYAIASNGKIVEYLNVGDYVDYEPTKTDVNKTQAVEASKLTYTSPEGGYDSTEGKITHGNGWGTQVYTAKANDGTSAGLKWRVLGISGENVELISEVPVVNSGRYSGNFVLRGGIAYLYAEQELNEVCKIYGYGYGADTSMGAAYTVGGPLDTPVTGTIEGTGARSITIEDLNKIAGVYEENGRMKCKDGTDVSGYNYGTESYPYGSVYYPTLYSSNTEEPGKSKNSKSGGFKVNTYAWDRSKIANVDVQNLLFNGNYWISSRFTGSDATYAWFYIGCANTNGFERYSPCHGSSWNLPGYWNSSNAVRPVVSVKLSAIDVDTDYASVGEWKLK